MGIKSSEQFHVSLIAQYKEMIHEALLESDHKLEFDHFVFESKLTDIIKYATADGLTKTEIMNLVEEAKNEIPSHAKAA